MMGLMKHTQKLGSLGDTISLAFSMMIIYTSSFLDMDKRQPCGAKAQVIYNRSGMVYQGIWRRWYVLCRRWTVCTGSHLSGLSRDAVTKKNLLSFTLSPDSINYLSGILIHS